MGRYQFVHIECYSRKPDSRGRSVAFVLDEAARKPDACSHVPAPLPFELLWGIPLNEARTKHDSRAADARETLAGGKTRKVHQDQLTLLTVVASHPATMSEVRGSPAVAEEVRRWEDRVVNWLRDRWGHDMLSVVRHTDETHAHLHTIILPSDPEMRARHLHPVSQQKRQRRPRPSRRELTRRPRTPQDRGG